jgi:hypothetical protein
MEHPQTPIRIALLERLQDGIMIVFSDDKTILFPTGFLYEHRADKGTQDFTNVPDFLG